MSEPGPSQSEEEFDLARSNALSDGVFAIALTLLVLQIELPPGAAGDLWGALGDTLPEIQGYVISFAVIALLWLHHHRLFGRLVRIDQRLVVLNLAFLGAVAFLPFPSELLGDFGDEAAAPILFAVSMSLVGLIGALMRRHAGRAGLLRPGGRAEPGGVGALWPLVFLASVPLALIDPNLAELSWLVLSVPAVRGRGR
jgi:uncharacterized membrane protein